MTRRFSKFLQVRTDPATLDKLACVAAYLKLTPSETVRALIHEKHASVSANGSTTSPACHKSEG